MSRSREVILVADEVVARITEQVSGAGWVRSRSPQEVVLEFLYQESLRQRRDGSTLAERRFLESIQRRFPKATVAVQRQLIEEITRRYVAEICANFDKLVPRIVHRGVPAGFRAVFSTLYPIASLDSLWEGGRGEPMVIEGEVELVRKLVKKGSVVFMLTHQTNADALLFSASLRRMRFPPVAHPASKSYVENPLVRYMFGANPAWTVDRSRTDPLYYEAVHEFSAVLAESGFPQFYFPIIERAASGALPAVFNRKVFSPALSAFRNQLRLGIHRPVFVIPVTLNYPFVLEAELLADEWVDGSNFSANAPDAFQDPARWIAYVRSLFSIGTQMRVRFGQPLDVLGNPVNEQGASIGSPGRLIDPGDYFRVNGEYYEDLARDREYLSCLAHGVHRGLRQQTVVYPVHVLAYALFHKFWDPERSPDWRRFLHGLEMRRPSVDEDELRKAVGLVLEQLARLAADGEIVLDPSVASLREDRVFELGVRVLTSVHTRPVIRREDQRVSVASPRVLFYYRNRLDGYGLFGHEPLVERECLYRNQD